MLRGGDQYLDFTIKGVSGQVLQEARTRPRWITTLDTNLYAEGRPMTEQEIAGVWQPPIYRGRLGVLCLQELSNNTIIIYVICYIKIVNSWPYYISAVLNYHSFLKVIL